MPADRAAARGRRRPPCPERSRRVRGRAGGCAVVPAARALAVLVVASRRVRAVRTLRGHAGSGTRRASAPPVTLADGQLSHDDIGQVVSFGGSTFTVWQGRYVGVHPPASRSPVRATTRSTCRSGSWASPLRSRCCALATAISRQVSTRSRGLLRRGFEGRPRTWRYENQGWTIVTDAAETATIADYDANPPLLQRKRLRLVRHAPPPRPGATAGSRTAPAFEMRMPHGDLDAARVGRVRQPLRAGRLAGHRGPSADAVDCDAGRPREPRRQLVVQSRHVSCRGRPVRGGRTNGDRSSSRRQRGRRAVRRRARVSHRDRRTGAPAGGPPGARSVRRADVRRRRQVLGVAHHRKNRLQRGTARRHVERRADRGRERTVRLRRGQFDGRVPGSAPRRHEHARLVRAARRLGGARTPVATQSRVRYLHWTSRSSTATGTPTSRSCVSRASMDSSRASRRTAPAGERKAAPSSPRARGSGATRATARRSACSRPQAPRVPASAASSMDGSPTK